MQVMPSYEPSTKLVFPPDTNYKITENLHCRKLLTEAFDNALIHIETLHAMLLRERDEDVLYVLKPAFGQMYAQKTAPILEKLEDLLRYLKNEDTRVQVESLRDKEPQVPVQRLTNGDTLAFTNKMGKSLGFLREFYEQEPLARDFIMIHELTHLIIGTQDAFEHPRTKALIVGYEHTGLNQLLQVIPDQAIHNADSYSIAAIRAMWLKTYKKGHRIFGMRVLDGIRRYHKRDVESETSEKMETLLDMLKGLGLKSNDDSH